MQNSGPVIPILYIKHRVCSTFNSNEGAVKSMNRRFTLQWEITKNDDGKLLKQFLQEQNISKTALTDIKFRGGALLVNGQHVTVRHKLQAGQTLTVIFPEETPAPGLKGEPVPLQIVFEDEVLLVINKPPFVSTIPSREHPTGSLANGLVHYYKNIGICSSPHIVTRLDRNTSGLVLVAKYRHIHHLFSLQQQKNKIYREYEAFVEGNLKKAEGTIEAPIARKENSIIERTVCENGQYACTHYKKIASYPGFTHVLLHLETGRTHQIRVHMAHIGHPLVGDDLYGGSTKLIGRQALHCRRLKFWHPANGECMEFTLPLPEDMKSLIYKTDQTSTSHDGKG